MILATFPPAQDDIETTANGDSEENGAGTGSAMARRIFS